MRLQIVLGLWLTIAMTGAGTAAVAAQQNPSAPAQEISGRIEDASGRPVAQAMIELRVWSGGVLASQSTSETGSFEFMVQSPGPFELQVSQGGMWQSIPLEGVTLSNMTLRVGNAAPAPGRSSAATVSLNDLEAPGKAKSKLAAAEKALGKLQLQRAWKLVNQAIEAAPNWGRAYLLRGAMKLQERNYDAARPDLLHALQADPRNAAALTQLGKLDAATGRWVESDTYLRRALQIEPVLWPTYFELANLDMRRGNYAEAEKMANYAEFSTPPGPPATHYLAAEAAYHLQEWDTAVIEYRSFLALAPDTPELQRSRQAARSRLGEIGKKAISSKQ